MTTTPETGMPSPCTCDPATNVMCPHCTARFWKGQLAATRALLDEAVGLVKECEWRDGDHRLAWHSEKWQASEPRACEDCGGINPDDWDDLSMQSQSRSHRGHTADCPLAAFLNKVKGVKDEA